MLIVINSWFISDLITYTIQNKERGHKKGSDLEKKSKPLVLSSSAFYLGTLNCYLLLHIWALKTMKWIFPSSQKCSDEMDFSLLTKVFRHPNNFHILP